MKPAQLAPSVPRAIQDRVVIAFVLLVAPSCASHEGWSGGRQVVLRSLDTLEFRRSEIELDEKTGDLVLHWVGARAQDGAPDILDCTLTVFADRNGNNVPEHDEILMQRSGDSRGRKIQFDDVRLPNGERLGRLTAMLVVHTDREERSRHWYFVPDS